MREITPITIQEDGTETHESWIVLTASRVQGSGQWLFDSDIRHHRFVTVTVHRCERRRQLNHDWVHATTVLARWSMSLAQWGAFVSSFGDGSGVPATLEFWSGEGHVPAAPHASRLAESHAEVKDAANRSLEAIRESYAALEEAFEGGGKRAQREALRELGIRLQNAPANMEFAASSLTEHVENVVTKARADIEAMVEAASERGLTVGEDARALLPEGGDTK